MSYENICISCFEEKHDELCEKCGFAEELAGRSKYVLPARTVLDGKYLVGEVVNSDRDAVEYKALNLSNNCIVEIQEYFPREIVCRASDGLSVSIISKKNTEMFNKNVSKIGSNALRMYEFSGSPYIVNIFDCFEDNNTVYIVREYTEGMVLSDFVQASGGRLSIEAAKSIMVPVLEGLMQIHKSGLVHRALTPRSIIITTDNKVKITDFRFLKEASPYKEEAMTVHFAPGYAPPEQYCEKSKQGAFSDIYSAGAILYKIITGQKATDAINRLGGVELVPPSSIEPSIPEYVSISVMKAMNMTAELRFKSAADFKNCLLEKKDVVDVDTNLKKIKDQKFNQTTIAMIAAVVAVAGFILYKILA